MQNKSLRSGFIFGIVVLLSPFFLNAQVNTVTFGADRGKLVPTPIAEVTTDFLVKYFQSIVDFDFTAKVEAGFERVAGRSTKPLRKPLGIAIVAACADLRAARHRIPRRVSPLDRCRTCHGVTLSR